MDNSENVVELTRVLSTAMKIVYQQMIALQAENSMYRSYLNAIIEYQEGTGMAELTADMKHEIRCYLEKIEASK